MSETRQKLEACTRISEWIDPWDQRLAEIAESLIA